jgi:hypothetical protein
MSMRYRLSLGRNKRNLIMHLHLLRSFAILVLCGLCGCQSFRLATATPERAEPAASGEKSFDLTTRNNALALLNELLNDEKNVNKILIIKRDSPELKSLINNISQSANHGAKRLKSMAEKDPRLHLSLTGLPPGEQAARKAITKTNEQILLQSKGAEFEFQLLLTQAEALNYGAHLAQVAADNEPRPARAQEFSEMSIKLKTLRQQVLAMLRKAHSGG